MLAHEHDAYCSSARRGRGGTGKWGCAASHSFLPLTAFLPPPIPAPVALPFPSRILTKFLLLGMKCLIDSLALTKEKASHGKVDSPDQFNCLFSGMFFRPCRPPSLPPPSISAFRQNLICSELDNFLFPFQFQQCHFSLPFDRLSVPPNPLRACHLCIFRCDT